MAIERIWTDDVPNQPADGAAAAIKAPVEQTTSAGVVDEAAQRRMIEEQIHAQARSLDPAALHDKHDAPGAAPTPLPEDMRTRGETQSLDALLAYRGCRLLAADGEDVGEVAEIYFDEATLVPEWIGVDVGGVLGATRVVAPVRGSYLFAREISVPYSRDHVLACEAGELSITPDRERQLYQHFGLPYSRVLSPTGLPAGTNTAAERAGSGAFLTASLTDSQIVVPEIADGVPPPEERLVRPVSASLRTRGAAGPVRRLLIPGVGASLIGMFAVLAWRRHARASR